MASSCITGAAGATQSPKTNGFSGTCLLTRTKTESGWLRLSRHRDQSPGERSPTHAMRPQWSPRAPVLVGSGAPWVVHEELPRGSDLKGQPTHLRGVYAETGRPEQRPGRKGRCAQKQRQMENYGSELASGRKTGTSRDRMEPTAFSRHLKPGLCGRRAGEPSRCSRGHTRSRT